MSDISKLGAAPIQAPEMNVPAIERAKTKKDLEKAAKQFEHLFTDIVMKSMRNTVPESEIEGGQENKKIFQQMLDSEYSKTMTTKGKGLGLADAIVRQLLPRVEAAQLSAQTGQAVKPTIVKETRESAAAAQVKSLGDSQ